MNPIFKAGFTYFLIVFGAGFAFGLIRVPFLVPRFGERYAELIEMPLLLVAIVFASKWIVRRFTLTGLLLKSLGTGFLAAILLLSVEFSVVLWLRGLTLEQFLADRDPLAGTIYYLMVCIFAISPFVFARRDTTK